MMPRYNAKIQNIEVNFQPLPEGGYRIIIPALPEIEAGAENLKEAKKKAEEIINNYDKEIKSKEPEVDHSDLKHEATRDTILWRAQWK